MAHGKTNETDIAGMTVAELRRMARERGVSGGYRMRKEELVRAVGKAGATRSGGGRSSNSLKYAQRIKSVKDRPDRPGRSLVTREHEVIRHWAEQRDAAPATVPGSWHDGHPGVLRFDFPGYGGQDLEHVGWDEWFAAFDARRLNFIYQEQTRDGRQSNFFQLENPDREDA